MKSIFALPSICFAALLAAAHPGSSVQAETPAVAASIKPVHSLLSAVMEGAGSPTLIVEGAKTPHHYALKPSQARLLEKADAIFWIGPELESFLEKPIHTIAADAQSIALIDIDGLTVLDFDEGHGHEEDSHGKDDGHEEEEGGNHTRDPHIWLDPRNAGVLARTMAQVLIDIDPEHADLYRRNTTELLKELDRLESELNTILAPVRGTPYLTFHDAYSYFEERFAVPAAGTVTVSPEKTPGAERVRAVQTQIREKGARCIFAEPQFEPKIIDIVTEGTAVRKATLDPLGAELDPGITLYEMLLRNMATSMRDCLVQ